MIQAFKRSWSLPSVYCDNWVGVQGECASEIDAYQTCRLKAKEDQTFHMNLVAVSQRKIQVKENGEKELPDDGAIVGMRFRMRLTAMMMMIRSITDDEMRKLRREALN